MSADGKPGLVLPHASPSASREDAMQGDPMPVDIPFEKMLYRTTSGLLLTSSLIRLGIGAGQRMTGVARLTEEEARDYLELLDEHVAKDALTDFEHTLKDMIVKKLGKRWT